MKTCSLHMSFAVAGPSVSQNVSVPVMTCPPSGSDGGSGAGRMPSIMEENG